MIEIRNVTKRFGCLEVLKGVDLDIAPGAVTAILGPNAAGKTTLIKSILGLTKPDGGQILVDGHRLNGDWSYRANVGYMPQSARFPENLSGRDVIRLVTRLRSPQESRLSEYLAGFAVASEIDKPIRTLSGGTRQKLSQLLGEVGSILRNPVDVSQAQFRGLSTLFQSIDLVARDAAIDIILIQEDMDILLPIYSWKGLEEINDFFVELGSRQNKPIVVVLPHGSAEFERIQIEQKLLGDSISVFCSMERAAKAIHNINQYFCRWEAR